MLGGMATRETRADRGRARARTIAARLIGELAEARKLAGLSQQAMARFLDWSQSEVSRFERVVNPDAVSVVDIGQFAAVLGRELAANLFPAGDPIRDKGHQALIRRFVVLLSKSWQVAREVPLPNIGDPRVWDVVLRGAACRVGVEAETRIRDVQALTRRIHERERYGGVDQVLLVLSASTHNRRLLEQLLEALGPRFQTPPRQILKALRDGSPIPGSGVILL
jgi:transcriptional regulator with XRE-family HTH domain